MTALTTWYAAQNELLSLIQNAPMLAHVPVFDGAVPDGTEIPLLPSGGVAPHVAVVFGGVVNRKQQGTEGIVSSAQDSFTGQFVVFSIAGVPGDARHLAQIVADVVVGYEPVNCGEVQPAFFAGVMQAGSANPPTRYSADQSFMLLVNSTDQ